ncbi:MAG: hypothetical protein NTW87_21345, partial [Planctomycetota bacterium]|nr:hypothetical protein [Planctomycetota bacterium]
PPGGVGERVLKAGVAVLAANLIQKLAGFLIKKVIPNYYGLAVSDVFSVVNDTVLGTAFSIGEQCLGPAYMPVFTGAKEKEGEARAWRYTSVLFNLQFLILLVITAVLMLFPGPIIGLFTQWDSTSLAGDADAQERHGLAGLMLPYVAPALLGMSLASLTYWVLISYKKFFFAAFGDALLKFAVLGGAALGAALKSGDWHFIAAGAVAGGALKLLLHLFVLGRQWLRQYRPTLDLKDQYLRSFFLLVLPLLLGIIVSRWRDAVMVNVLTVKPGLPTYFSMGRGVVESVGFLIPLSLSIALLPYFCDMAARDDRVQLGRLLTQTIRMLVWFFVPLSIVLAVAALPTCMVLYRGKIIDVEKARCAALVLQLFCLQLPFLATEMMVNQAFFSNRRMVAPTTAGIVLSLVSAGLAYAIVKYGGLTSSLEILGVVALCLVLIRVLKCFILIALLKWTVPVLPLRETMGYLARLVAAGGGAAVAALGAQYLYRGPLSFVDRALRSGHASNALEALFIALAGAAVYLVLSLLLKMEEPRLGWQWTKEKLRRRGQKLPTPTAGPDAA